MALVAVGATIAQLGLVNALFRFAAEREGDARFAVARTAIALCCVAGVVLAAVAALATPVAAPLFLGDGHEALWLVACGGLLVSLLYEPCAGLYRVEQRPQRFLAVTLVNVVVTVVVSVVWIIHFDGGALGADGRLLHRARSSRCGVVLWDRRDALFGPIDRALAGPLLRFGLPFMPSRVALWALNLSNRLLVALARDRRARRRVRRRRERGLGRRAARDGVPAGLAAVRLRRSRTTARRARVYRSVLTRLAARRARGRAAARARARLADRAAGGREVAAAAPTRWRCSALGLAFYGAYYVVGVAVGRAKRTQLNWVVTGHRGGHERRALHRADPRLRREGRRRGVRDRLLPDGGADGRCAATASSPSATTGARLARALRARRRRSSRSATRPSPARGAGGVAGRLVVAGAVRPARAQRRSGSAPRSACGGDGRLLARRARRRRQLPRRLEHAQARRGRTPPASARRRVCARARTVPNVATS